ncbi:alpha/beta hydrolase [Bacteroides sp. 214]|uniref:alpha/beta hydrolase n=1 Tax=Bacteroides sp. 214 TaxID=2302935 RepID=UPI0013D1B8E5|nr:alpha/beta hydrolase [Bacteroides sp. 214]NDW11583.1 alpha/beta hydrolase [Bacteroides sp. 214]
MRKFIIFCALFASVNLCAQQPVEILLWPNGAPNSNELKGEEKRAEGNRVSNITEPSITIYKSDTPNSIAIIMCPGGGYARLAMNHEGFDMAPWMLSQHITYVVLKYRMPNGNHEVPLSDAEQAIRYMRQHAEEYNTNPNKIGIMGASAGGHLASTLATHYSSKETRPDFQILFYPVITLDLKYCHGGSRDNLLGKNPSQELVDKYSNEKQVTEDTPKAFIMLSSNDKTVPAENSTQYFLALKNKGVSASLHSYPIGSHGWGFRDSFVYKRQWTEELEKWLREEVQ